MGLCRSEHSLSQDKIPYRGQNRNWNAINYHFLQGLNRIIRLVQPVPPTVLLGGARPHALYLISTCPPGSLDTEKPLQMETVGRGSHCVHVPLSVCEYPVWSPQGSLLDPLAHYTNHIKLSTSFRKIWFLPPNSVSFHDPLLLLSARVSQQVTFTHWSVSSQMWRSC